VAVTTYFGNGIQDWAHEQSIAQAGTDDPWFYTTATFDAGGGNQRPVTVAPSEPYWTSEALERHLNATFDEWEYRLLSGDAREGAGPDAVGIGGGFGEGIRELANTVFGNPKPIIAYEGGPSLYTDGLDGGDSRDDGITIFMEALNRHPRFRDVYSMHLNMAKSKGLWTHTMFTDFGPWGKYGQWGHLEYPTQPPADSPKYQFLLDWMAEQASINHLDQPVGSVPSFVTQHRLPVAVFGLPYSADIEVAGGDGPRRITVLGSSLRDGLTIDELPVNPDLVRIAGTPVEGGLSFVYLRVVDGDGDPAWRTYNVRTVGGPNTILEVNFEGTSPALSLPWTSTYIASPLITYSGLTAGAGISRQSGDNAFVFQTAMPADEVNSTLALAITDNEYVAFSITPTSGRRLTLAGHEMRFTIRRLSWHAPRRYAVLTSVEGFDATAAVFTTARTQDETDLEFRFTFPNDAAYLGIQEPVEIRLYGFQGQYSGHRTSITEIRLDGLLAEEDTRVMDLWGAY
jgi:hypothetical protein